MRFTNFSSTLCVLLAMLSIATAVPQNRNGGNNDNDNNNQNQNQDQNNDAANNNNNAGNNAGGGTTLDPANIQDASASDGNPDAAEGEAASETDDANFINFCSGKQTTNGAQVQGGSCNGIVMGDIPSANSMVSAVIVNPPFGETVEPNTDFDIEVQTANLVAGVFTNPDNTYYAAPQQLQGGQVVGHAHVVVQDLGGSLTPNTPPDASQFAFFKGINDAGNGNGLLSATVDGGLPEGSYRICTMNSAANHQPVLMPVAQRGNQDDCIRLTVAAGGGNNNNNNNNNQDNNNDNQNDNNAQGNANNDNNAQGNANANANAGNADADANQDSQANQQQQGNDNQNQANGQDADTGNNADTGDADDTGDAGNAGDTGNTGDTGNAGDTGADQDAGTGNDNQDQNSGFNRGSSRGRGRIRQRFQARRFVV